MTSKWFTILCVSLSLAACATDAPPVDRISANYCACNAAALGIPLSPEERDRCAMQFAPRFERAPTTCLQCLEHAIGDSSSPSACMAATACPCETQATSELDEPAEHVETGSLATKGS